MTFGNIDSTESKKSTLRGFSLGRGNSKPTCYKGWVTTSFWRENLGQLYIPDSRIMGIRTTRQVRGWMRHSAPISSIHVSIVWKYSFRSSGIVGNLGRHAVTQGHLKKHAAFGLSSVEGHLKAYHFIRPGLSYKRANVYDCFGHLANMTGPRLNTSALAYHKNITRIWILHWVANWK